MLNIFGRDYEEIGSSDKGLILKNSGKIKIQWGKKFIDLIDSNGNIATKTNKESLIKEIDSDEQIEKEGLYLQNNNLVAKTKNGEEIKITSEDGNTYVSFVNKQNITGNEKYTALQNLGLVFPTKSNENVYPTNGIIYIEDEQKLYIVKNGKLNEYIPPINKEYETIINELQNKIKELEDKISSYNDIDNMINELQNKVNNLEQNISQIQAINTDVLTFRLACREEENNND